MAWPSFHRLTTRIPPLQNLVISPEVIMMTSVSRFSAILLAGATLADCFVIQPVPRKHVADEGPGMGVISRARCAVPGKTAAASLGDGGRRPGRSALLMSDASDEEMVDISAEELEELMIKAGRMPPKPREPAQDQLEGAIQRFLQSPTGAAMFQQADAAGFSRFQETGQVPPNIMRAAQGAIEQQQKAAAAGKSAQDGGGFKLPIPGGFRNPFGAEDKDEKSMREAAEKGDVAAVEGLLSKGVGPDLPKFPEGTTPLMAASESGKVATVDLLISTGLVDIDRKDLGGQTALHKCALQGHADVAALLLEAGASPTSLTNANLGSVPPLHWAAFKGHTDTISVLVGGGAPVGYQDARGFTALHVAAAGGHHQAAERLLEAGADIEAKNGEGLTAADVAKLAGIPEATKRKVLKALSA